MQHLGTVTLRREGGPGWDGLGLGKGPEARDSGSEKARDSEGLRDSEYITSERAEGLKILFPMPVYDSFGTQNWLPDDA